MNDDKLKVMLAILSGVVFSLIFILLAFILPIHPDKVPQKTMDSELQKLSKEYQRNKYTPPPPEH
ncbi:MULTISPECIES: hypothetical protein [unclassified Sulfuricurvum]|uniref:hypothetical protein n=1 Tax=unclassified Sulfuricurvum TaxID=2632390 RepID=UPI000299911D|nr:MULTISPECIES: hypothetical protein [unclassified Sulfuricurvum]OHD86442.1 MAG: hypothetical protein A3I60_02105 [Sulfuricurvum sp. RIFCSPLOWO2_02_FULL_43_45]OHD87217.1 MAG: hypothetical protein A2Y52_05595 [Sulfuricurvum sp. RIFCSPLOWO2_02_43_6]AFV97127.1 hypothetical protein B649_04065 [Candidatus Sulfuricurvum sp. RIFRC-1]OHD88860.1 MAG: hypothetical protein A3G19_07385 [Sulfuricurvum sp. RIFCSPLOWO2_12_FULL_43_24]HBM35397.1 hypothetical protein [Sulfuricurvum sp.]